MTFDGTHIHIVDGFDDNVRMILPPTSGGQADLSFIPIPLADYIVPTGMAFDGTHIHIADVLDDNVRMILPPSADGQADLPFIPIL